MERSTVSMTGGRIDLDRAVVVLTGASSGIGLATAGVLGERAGRVIVHGLFPETAAVDDRDRVSGDFRRLASVGDVAQRIGALTDRVDVLINNAGIPGPPQRSLTSDGHEVTFQVNLLAGALLTDLLTPLLVRGGRVINVASQTHYNASFDPEDPEATAGSYSPVRAYAHSKLAVVMHSISLARRLRPDGVDVVSVHPGVISTGLLHAMFGAGGASTATAASVLLDLAERELETAAYYDGHEPAAPNRQALGRRTQEQLERYVNAAIEPLGVTAR
jgi:NAD(P)-dependent dehydrogenase (short-subunit alcohol dehydrogenase family)